MAKFGTIEVNVTGNLLPIARAMELMDDALRVYAHRWSPDEQATIDTARVAVLRSLDQENPRPDLDGRGN